MNDDHLSGAMWQLRCFYSYMCIFSAHLPSVEWWLEWCCRSVNGYFLGVGYEVIVSTFSLHFPILLEKQSNLFYKEHFSLNKKREIKFWSEPLTLNTSLYRQSSRTMFVFTLLLQFDLPNYKLFDLAVPLWAHPLASVLLIWNLTFSSGYLSMLQAS